MRESVSVLGHVRALLKQIEKRLEQRFKATQKAIDKAEAASDKRLAGMNEFRDALRDQAQTFLPRSEYTLARESNLARIAIVEKRVDEITTLAQGKALGLAMVVSVAAITGVVVAALGFILMQFGGK